MPVASTQPIIADKYISRVRNTHISSTYFSIFTLNTRESGCLTTLVELESVEIIASTLRDLLCSCAVRFGVASGVQCGEVSWRSPVTHQPCVKPGWYARGTPLAPS